MGLCEGCWGKERRNKGEGGFKFISGNVRGFVPHSSQGSKIITSNLIASHFLEGHRTKHTLILFELRDHTKLTAVMC